MNFEDKAVRYDKMVQKPIDDELGLFEKYDEVLEEIRRKILHHGAKTVVDIGCGTGNLCGELSTGIEVTGIDQSPEMLARAKEKYPSMKLKLGNFLDEPEWEQKADVVVTTYALHSLSKEEKQQAIRNMLTYLKADGKILIADFMFLDSETRTKCREKLCGEGREDLWSFIEGKHYADLEELQCYVRSLGCKIHSRHVVNFTWIAEIEKEEKLY